MAKNGFLKRRGIVRNEIKKDILYFALPGIIVFGAGLVFCGRAGLFSFWEDFFGQINQPRNLLTFSKVRITGLVLSIVGFIILCVGQITLFRNYSATVVIRENHQLVKHGLYRFTRNPMYLGLITAVMGFSASAKSLYGFLTMLVLIPIILNRISLEEKLLTEEFQDKYLKYKETTKKLIPFIY